MSEATARVPDAGWLRETPLAALLAALDSDGEEARVNGGAVRDAMLGLARGDIDIATTAVPETVIARAKANGWKPVPTGIEHGTVTVVIEGKPFEVTTLRRDVETDGRRAVVSFTRDWAQDARRRDLTINGLTLDGDGIVHDHVGGLEDLAAGRVRFIGDARERIREDYLRTLRFFRFHARFARGPLDEAGFAATIAERDGLLRLSGERVRAELLKLLVAPRAAETVAAMAQAGLLAPLTGGAPRLSRLARFVDRDADRPDALLRLAALLQFTSEDAARLKARLRLSNVESKRLEAIADVTPALSPADGEDAARRALYWLGESAYRDRARLAAVDARDEDWSALITLPDRWTPPTFPLTAADFKARGLEGPALGRALKAAEAAWVEAGFPEDAARIVEAILENTRKS
ncbi:CCA tRNA nucleotidyltransferase [Hansschlegelia quercus]|uniref:CCA tRNA nucleotidyltransferase n=1 Tax=Hansschlegelia quercus TaxID=2528245 RepID=A0A4V6MTL5_9HYPH|nr:CCA tRNA nucleotidyltransferase [Hansschlegelia quercus]TBN55026.1 CCA tRNA nucleotidyltransferase [Hansschlegelia quercus]